AVLATWWATIVVFEAASIHRFGATLGKLATGIRIVELDSVVRCSARASFRRAAFSTALEAIPIIGWALLLASLSDPLGRGTADRAAGTIVVRKHSIRPIRRRD